MSHKTLSFVKSGLRILGFGVVMLFTISPIIFFCFGAVIVAEIVGIIEEVVV